MCIDISMLEEFCLAANLDYKLYFLYLKNLDKKFI